MLCIHLFAHNISFMEAKASLQEKIRALVQEHGLEACCDSLQVSMTQQQIINQAILETSFDGFLLVDKEGWIQSCNEAAVRIFGYTLPQELVGSHIMNLVGGPNAEGHKRHFDDPPKPLPGTRIMSHMRDVPAKHKSGVEFRVTIGLCFLELDEKRHYVAFVRDLTRQKRQDELQQATFDASFDPIVLTDALGVIQTVNQALLDEFCYVNPEALIGESITKLLPEIECQMQELEGRKDREMTAFRSDGSMFPIKLGVQTIKADHLHELHFVGFIRNVTDEKKAMQVTKMEGEIRAHEAKVDTERAMTAYFAHEMRNPLGAIDSALATMPEDISKNAKEIRELHKSIKLFHDRRVEKFAGCSNDGTGQNGVTSQAIRSGTTLVRRSYDVVTGCPGRCGVSLCSGHERKMQLGAWRCSSAAASLYKYCHERHQLHHVWFHILVDTMV